MKTDNIRELLAAAFREDEIEWRLQSSGEKNGRVWGLCLAYVQSRAVMDRLDDVFGIAGWQDSYDFVKEDVVCRLSVKIGDDWITKMDGAPQTQVEAFKGGISDALKRAAVKFGIGRYLYNLDATFAEVVEKGRYAGKTKEGTFFKWNPPKLPAWALPASATKPSTLPERNGKVATKKDLSHMPDDIMQWSEEFFDILSGASYESEKELRDFYLANQVRLDHLKIIDNDRHESILELFSQKKDIIKDINRDSHGE